MTTASLRFVARSSVYFYQTYQHHFIGKGMNSTEHARHYLVGLLGTQRHNNMETIRYDVPGSDYQGLEQFIGTFPRCHNKLMEQVSRDASRGCAVADGSE